MKWVITQDDKDYGVPMYWTGETSDFGGFPIRTRELEEARKFDTASEAYARALTEPKLQGWRVRRHEEV